jgi:hypothetical protein
MCFNYKVSLFTFIVGVAFSLLLINLKVQKYSLENKITGIFLIFISLMQFIEFLFWIDIKNTYGINKITTILAPLINATQPIILYIIKFIYYKPNIFTIENLPVAILNLLYSIYFIFNYFRFLINKNERLITNTSDANSHLKWSWIKYFNSSFYMILLLINIFYLFSFNYAVVTSAITYLFLYISHVYFKYNTGEMWCFFGSSIPLIMYILSKYNYIDKLIQFRI